MGKLFLLFIIILSFNSHATDKQDYTNTVGLGLGGLYSGIGFNAGLKSENDMSYLSFGCTGYSSRTGSSCGFGLGHVTTTLFGSESNKHGVGIYISKIGEELLIEGDYDYVKYVERDYYGVGLGYTYFASGINRSGFNYGVSLNVTDAKVKSKYVAFLQLGYQF